ncbi:MAG: tetratricopeptide repeat protein, partial [Treponemataceae bacterium]
GLATTYLMLNEFEPAANLLMDLPSDSSADILFARFYNLGVIAYQNGDYNSAAQFFKDAIAIDKTNINTIINLELVTQQQQNLEKPHAQQNASSQTQTNTAENPVKESIFSLMKENDKNQWKNQPQSTDPSVLDY